MSRAAMTSASLSVSCERARGSRRGGTKKKHRREDDLVLERAAHLLEARARVRVFRDDALEARALDLDAQRPLLLGGRGLARGGRPLALGGDERLVEPREPPEPREAEEPHLFIRREHDLGT